MGIKGLWQILEPACERLPTQERLRGHRLAVDASIWMYQLTKALPSAESRSSSSSYNPLVLAGLVRRVCKLLHFGIKPVFVFDGGVPILKAATIMERRSRRAEAESRYKRLAKKMLKLRMSMVALGQPTESEPVKTPEPVVDEEEEILYSSSESELEDFDYEQLDQLDVDSADFKALPLDLRQELLMALKERVFREQLGRAAVMSRPEDALDFSKAQIDALVKRRKIADELERTSRSNFGAYSNKKDDGAYGHRIAGSSSREFVLIKSETGGWVFSDKNEQKNVGKKESVQEQVIDEEDDFEANFFADDSSVENPARAVVSKEPVIDEAVLHAPVVVEEADFLEEFEAEDQGLAEISSSESEELLPALPELLLRSEQSPLVSTENIPVTIVSRPEHEIPVQEQAIVMPVDHIHTMPVDLEAPSEEQYEDKDVSEEESEDQFLEEFKDVAREDLLKRLEETLNETRDGMRAAQNESNALENELLSDFQQILGLLGLPWMMAPMEAEAQCAWLQASGLVDGIITDDSDVLVFSPPGTPLLVYRHFFKDRKPVLVYGMPRIQLQMAMDRRDLIILAFLLGGDYGVGVRGIGSKRAQELLTLIKCSQTAHRVKDLSEAEYCAELLTLIKSLVLDFDTIGAELELEDQRALEKVLRNVHHIDDGFPSQAILNAYLQPSVSQDRRPFVWQTPNAPGLERLLTTRLGWSPAQFKAVVGPILKKLM